MESVALKEYFPQRLSPFDRHVQFVRQRHGWMDEVPQATPFFGRAAQERLQRYDADPKASAAVAEKNQRHSVHNPYSRFRSEHSIEEILDSAMIFERLTKLQCCPTSEGAAAAVLATGAPVNVDIGGAAVVAMH